MAEAQQPKPHARLGLGPSGAGYLFVMGLVLGLAIYTQVNLLFWGVGLLVGGLVVSLFVPGLMLSGVEAERIPPSHGVAGETTVLRYRIVNRKGWMPVFGLVIRESWGRGAGGWRRTGPVAERPPRLTARPHGWVLHLPPQAQVHAECPCWPTRRGPLSLEKVVLTTWFPFGAVRRDLEFEQPGQVLIYPHVFRLARRLVVRLAAYDPLGGQQRERGGGHEEFFGLRQYRPGDSLKLIDWKHSARTGQLVSREMTQVAPPRLIVGLDLRGAADAESGDGRAGAAEEAPAGEAASDAVERAISLAASLICEGHLAGYQVGMVVYGTADPAFPPHHSLPQRTRLLEALARLDASAISDEPGGHAMPAMAVAPTVIVRATGEDREGGRDQALVLSAERMHRHVMDAWGGAAGMLERRVRAPSAPKREGAA